jgi:deazaflavin-dependent oxidoreductase (nitroreductase family)
MMTPRDAPAPGQGIHPRQWKHNPFINSSAGGRALSALQLPLFLIHPPAAYGVLTTTGRKSGKKRSRCVRAVRREDHVYIVAIKAAATKGWLKNALANPDVQLRLPGGTFTGRARPMTEASERQQARETYCGTIRWFDYVAWMNWRKEWPTSSKIKGLLTSWFDGGTPLVIDLGRPSPASTPARDRRAALD